MVRIGLTAVDNCFAQKTSQHHLNKSDEPLTFQLGMLILRISQRKKLQLYGKSVNNKGRLQRPLNAQLTKIR